MSRIFVMLTGIGVVYKKAVYYLHLYNLIWFLLDKIVRLFSKELSADIHENFEIFLDPLLEDLRKLQDRLDVVVVLQGMSSHCHSALLIIIHHILVGFTTCGKWQ